jgi:hypothetical protein
MSFDPSHTNLDRLAADGLFCPRAAGGFGGRGPIAQAKTRQRTPSKRGERRAVARSHCGTLPSLSDRGLPIRPPRPILQR